MGSAGFAAFPTEGATAAGHRVAQSCEQVGLQQPISSWLIPDEEDAAIGQSAAGTANAGPEAIARDKASTMMAIRRRMAVQIRQATLTGNYDAPGFPYRSVSQIARFTMQKVDSAATNSRKTTKNASNLCNRTAEVRGSIPLSSTSPRAADNPPPFIETGRNGAPS